MKLVGIDVQVARDCPYVVLGMDGTAQEYGWLPPAAGAPEALTTMVSGMLNGGPVVVAIDAPRRPLLTPRAHEFRSGRWRAQTGKGHGRHCEVILKSLGLANPQWTPLAGTAPPWMKLGFALFGAAAAADRVLEVFPTATYNALTSCEPTPIRLSLEAFAPGPKDMLDAVAAAVTAMRFVQGLGSDVGGGDGLGTIVLPRHLTPREASSPVHDWPGAKANG